MSAKTIARIGMMTALAMIFSYIEAMLPLSLAVPGIKMGLPNIVIVFALFHDDPKTAIVVSTLRVILVSILFGNGASIWYAFSGAVFSLTTMILLKHFCNFHTVTVSVCGGVAHNIGQIFTAVFLLGTDKIIFYLPVLIISGVASGAGIGIVAAIIVRQFINR